MKPLIPFNNSTSDFKLEANVTRDIQLLTVIYNITDTKNLLNLPGSFSSGDKTLREDGLWNDTCFELFLRPVNKTSYYEFNFSLKQAWNEYSFDSYRKPQPPQRCYDISLKSIKWNGQSLEIELSGLNANEKYEVSVTAVLKENSGAIHYMAVKHAGPEADFHHVDSFIPL